MPLRIRRRLRVFPGVHLNVGMGTLSTSIGGRGAHVTFGPHGTRLSAGIPGTGLGWYQNFPTHRAGCLPAGTCTDALHTPPCVLPSCNPAMVPAGRALGFILV